jgi:hypothetical protein
VAGGDGGWGKEIEENVWGGEWRVERGRWKVSGGVEGAEVENGGDMGRSGERACGWRWGYLHNTPPPTHTQLEYKRYDVLSHPHFLLHFLV